MSAGPGDMSVSVFSGKNLTPFPNYAQRHSDMCYEPEVRRQYYSPYRSFVTSF